MSANMMNATNLQQLRNLPTVSQLAAANRVTIGQQPYNRQSEFENHSGSVFRNL
jgi:hypothetical protein